LLADEDKLFDIYRKRYFKGIRYRPGLAMAKEVQIREQVLNCCATFGRAEKIAPGVKAARQALLSLKVGRIPEDLTEKIRIVMSDLDGVTDYVYCRIKGQEQCTPVVHLRARIE